MSLRDFFSAVYLCLLLAAIIVGFIRFRNYDSAIRIIPFLLAITFIVELFAPVAVKNDWRYQKGLTFHVFNVLQLVMIGLVFLRMHKPRHYARLRIMNYCLWPLLGLLNIIFLQPVTMFNSNFLLMESFVINTLCLYSIYAMLKKGDDNFNIFRQPHFWLCITWLLEWSSTFFFWAFIRILYHNHWAYMDLAINLNTVVNLLVYSGIGIILLLYPKNRRPLENF